MNMRTKCCCGGEGVACSVSLAIEGEPDSGGSVDVATSFEGLPICRFDNVTIKALATGNVTFGVSNETTLESPGGPYAILVIKKNGTTIYTLTAADIHAGSGGGGAWNFPIAVTAGDVLSIELEASSISNASTTADLTMTTFFYSNSSTCGDCPP